jgi:hypothetical protein
MNNRLSHRDAQRIIAIFEECVQKIQLLYAISREGSSVEVGEILKQEEVASYLKQQKALEEMFNESVTLKKTESKQEKVLTKIINTLQESFIHETGQSLKVSTVALTQVLSVIGNIIS